MDNRRNNHAFGGWAEEEVARILELTRGWRLRAKRARYREGEIDLILESAQGLEFVEVKARRSAHYGAVVEQVTTQKLRRLKRAEWRWRAATNERRPGRWWLAGLDREGLHFLPLEI